MKIKQGIKIIVDTGMFVLLTLLMGEHLLPGKIHEWIGVFVFAQFVLHTVLNFKWYKNLFKGRYTVFRIVDTVVTLSLLVAMLLCIISAIPISTTVFAFIKLNQAHFGRTLHLITTAWIYMLSAVHLGLHWQRFVVIGKKVRLPFNAKRAVKWVIRICIFSLCIYGISVWINRAFYEELFLLTEFKYFDYSKTVMEYFWETITMAIAAASIAYYLRKIAVWLKRKNNK